ncbi:hypothetical protein SAMN06893096_102176 [Geodermatophilus pulveris]|uniref:Uncharacterized protein n=1 Tax=Geodermatophilus pulveris TaxID=1564159 RepID=A0A239C1S4_9ACTN|nr:hypothetical protein [Geodermatophilus pulveris]SNS13591.1 hypothetical protein SAMN06893096_102176 [Geodermatophilus pulveris]
MASPLEAHVKEYEQLRQEILARINLAYALIALDLTVLGAGLTVFDTLPDVVAGLAVASSFLWLIFIDHAAQVYKLAAYIALWLAPEIRTAAPGSLRWEEFLRQVDQGGAKTAHALFGRQDAPQPVGWIKSGGPSPFLAALFGGSPPVLLAAYAASSGLSGSLGEQAVRGGVLFASLGFWLLAMSRYRSFRWTVKYINEAIAESRERPGGGTSDVSAHRAAADAPHSTSSPRGS